MDRAPESHYIYADNNPVLLTDPSGLMTEKFDRQLRNLVRFHSDPKVKKLAGDILTLEAAKAKAGNDGHWAAIKKSAEDLGTLLGVKIPESVWGPWKSDPDPGRLKLEEVNAKRKRDEAIPIQDMFQILLFVLPDAPTGGRASARAAKVWHHISLEAMLAILYKESSFNPDAKNTRGDYGLGQTTPIMGEDIDRQLLGVPKGTTYASLTLASGLGNIEAQIKATAYGLGVMLYYEDVLERKRVPGNLLAGAFERYNGAGAAAVTYRKQVYGKSDALKKSGAISFKGLDLTIDPTKAMAALSK